MRKYPFVVLGVCLLLFAALVSLTWPVPCPVTKAASDRIKVGMGRAVVEEILGGPPGDYRTRPTEQMLLGSAGWGNYPLNWLGDEGAVQVVFAGDEVWSKRFIPSDEADVGISRWELLRWRLNRRWDRLWGK